jgi:hypothetical protein
MRTVGPVRHCREVMRTYLVERYWPGVTDAAFADTVAQAAAATRDLQAAGHLLEFLGSVLVPTDEVAFWRFQSESRSSVEEASARAGLAYDRVVECVELPTRPTGTAR